MFIQLECGKLRAFPTYLIIYNHAQLTRNRVPIVHTVKPICQDTEHLQIITGLLIVCNSYLNEVNTGYN